jgi:hypothetical protein
MIDDVVNQNFVKWALGLKCVFLSIIILKIWINFINFIMLWDFDLPM